jgi:lipoprotein-releasing system permease protein
VKKRAAFFIALRYLWGRANEGGRYLRGAAAGVAVSLVPIIVTLIVADGMIMGIIDRYIELGTGHLQVFEMFSTADRDETIEKIKATDGVRGVWPETRGTGVLAGRDGKAGVTVRAVEPSFWTDPGGGRFLKVVYGEQKPETDRDILLGLTLAVNTGAHIGDTVRLMTIKNIGGNQLPVTTPFVVRGIVSCGYNELDALWCIISYEGGKRVLSEEQSSSSLIVKIDNPYKKAGDVSWALYQNLESGYSIYTWKELLRSQYSSYESTRQLLLFIMALIVIVAAVNVSSSTSMLALERNRDIAILKVSGAGVKGVTDIFLFGGFLTGLTGAVIGITAGLLIGININSLIHNLEKGLSFVSNLFHGEDVKILDPGFYLETIPIIIDRAAVFVIGFFAVFCSVLASWIPAKRAGKLKPMELLRKT